MERDKDKGDKWLADAVGSVTATDTGCCHVSVNVSQSPVSLFSNLLPTAVHLPVISQCLHIYSQCLHDVQFDFQNTQLQDTWIIRCPELEKQVSRFAILRKVGHLIFLQDRGPDGKQLCLSGCEIQDVTHTDVAIPDVNFYAHRASESESLLSSSAVHTASASPWSQAGER